jgi:Uncharacterized Fe-S center protein
MPRVIVNAARCVNARKTVCSRCADICHSHSIRLGGMPSIDRLSCNDCGACAAICPTDALAAFDSGRFLGRVRRLPKSASIVLGCKMVAGPGSDVVGLEHCFSALGADALMGLVALGFASVIFAHRDGAGLHGKATGCAASNACWRRRRTGSRCSACGTACVLNDAASPRPPGGRPGSIIPGAISCPRFSTGGGSRAVPCPKRVRCPPTPRPTSTRISCGSCAASAGTIRSPRSLGGIRFRSRTVATPAVRAARCVRPGPCSVQQGETASGWIIRRRNVSAAPFA